MKYCPRLAAAPELLNDTTRSALLGCAVAFTLSIAIATVKNGRKARRRWRRGFKSTFRQRHETIKTPRDGQSGILSDEVRTLTGRIGSLPLNYSPARGRISSVRRPAAKGFARR